MNLEDMCRVVKLVATLVNELDATREALSVCEQERDVDRVKYREALADMIDAFGPWTGMTDKQERAVENARRALGGSDADV